MGAANWFQALAVGCLLLCISGSDATAKTYTTDFPAGESAISEGGNWVNGQSLGVDWSDVLTTNHAAFGTEDGTRENAYADSTAILTGTWGSNQTVTATVFMNAPNDTYYPETELRLRSSLAAHNCTGYEIIYSCQSNMNCYISIVRWNGAVGDFLHLGGVSGNSYILTNGATIKATMVGSNITAYLNGIAVVSTSDTTWTNGNPGFGFDHCCSVADVPLSHGLSTFTATDGIDPPLTLLSPMVTNGQFSFSFQTELGQDYFILQFTNIAASDLGTYTRIAGTGLPYQFSTPVTKTQPGSLFRVMVP